MMTKVKSLAILAPLVLSAMGCDLQLLPEAATYDGHGTPRMAVVVEAEAMPQGGVVAVDLELVDVLIHRERDDAWIWIAGDASRVELSLAGTAPQSSVPLLADHYDRLLVVVDAPRVAMDGSWQRAALTNDEIEIDIDLELDGDTRVELCFDVAASLSAASGQWHFDPRATVRLAAQ